MNEALQIADQIVRWVTPFVAGFIALLVFIYRGKVTDLEKLIETEKEERDEEIKKIMLIIDNYEETRKEAQKDLLGMFKEGLREEREFRTDMIIKQSNQIEKIFERIEDVLVSIGRLDQRVESHVENQEKICRLQHEKK